MVNGFWSRLIPPDLHNRFFGFGGFLPLPSVDGQVIWRELLQPISTRLEKKVASETNKNPPPSPRSGGNP
jgi:hypothetical protein